MTASSHQHLPAPSEPDAGRGAGPAVATAGTDPVPTERKVQSHVFPPVTAILPKPQGRPHSSPQSSLRWEQPKGSLTPPASLAAL